MLNRYFPGVDGRERETPQPVDIGDASPLTVVAPRGNVSLELSHVLQVSTVAVPYRGRPVGR
jgi:hypothetical protein